MRNLFNRLGDRINPIVVKEMRQAVNSRFVSFTFIVFLIIELLVMMLMLLVQAPSDSDLVNFRTGRQVFEILQGILMGSCMILIPFLTGGRLAAERSDVNVDLLFISSLSPRAIMSGKFLAATALAILIFSACAPFMTFAYLLRGLEISTIFLTLANDFLAVLVGTMFALLVASIPASRGFRIILAIVGFILLALFSVWVQRISQAFLEFDFMLEMMASRFWLACSIVVLAVIAAIGLMFVWATALISPPTSNRILPIRIYTLGLWALLAAIGGIWSRIIVHDGPMSAWCFIGVSLFSFHMLMASSERDHWGPRVLRRVPRSPFWRLPAFFFFSGSAGGFAYSILGVLATIAGYRLWEQAIAYRVGVRVYDSSDETAKLVSMIAGYTYCFSMTGVLVRRMLHKTPFKPSATWLLAIILSGLGSLLSFLAHEAFFPKRYSYIYSRENIWLFLPSAAVMIDEQMSDRGAAVSISSIYGMTMVFLFVWGAVVTLLNIEWLARQVRSFRPPKRNLLKAASGAET